MSVSQRFLDKFPWKHLHNWVAHYGPVRAEDEGDVADAMWEFLRSQDCDEDAEELMDKGWSRVYEEARNAGCMTFD